MKQRIFNHVKVFDLMRILKIPKYVAIGILETLWHFTDEKSSECKIVIPSNKTISEAIGWPGSEDLLVNALIRSGWLTKNEESSLVWLEHCTKNVRTKYKNMRRKNLSQLNCFFLENKQLELNLSWEPTRKALQKGKSFLQNKQLKVNSSWEPNGYIYNNNYIYNKTTKTNNIYNKLFKTWNSQKIIVHEGITSQIRSAIFSALKQISKLEKSGGDKTVAKIEQAIVNYAFVLKSEEHYFNHKWIFEDFLKRGVKKFLNSADPKNNFLKKQSFSGNDGKAALEKWKQKRKEVKCR